MKNTAYHHGDLKQSLIDAAKDIIAEDGVNNFSLRKAALKVGVSQAALYRHFDGKEQLLAALARNCFLQVGEQLQLAHDSAQDDPQQKLKAVGLAYVVYASKNPNLYRLMFDASLSDKQRYPELTDARRQALKWPAKSVTSIAKNQKESHQTQFDNTKFLLQSSIHGIASFVIDGHAPNDQSLSSMIDALVDQTLIGAT
ncbi:MAG: TetR/AcrR family transcriptional regulator [Cellvibrionaceae bacterium]